MLLAIVVILVFLGLTFETTINIEEAVTQGIIFHKDGKILITEKFINVEFLVPFPRYNSTIRQQVVTLLNGLATIWVALSAFCNSTYAKTYMYKTDVFNVDWHYIKILNETVEAVIEVLKLRNETKKLMTRVEEEPTNRQKRAAPQNISRSCRNGTLRPRKSYEQRWMRRKYRNFWLLPTNVSKL